MQFGFKGEFGNIFPNQFLIENIHHTGCMRQFYILLSGKRVCIMTKDEFASKGSSPSAKR